MISKFRNKLIRQYSKYDRVNTFSDRFDSVNVCTVGVRGLTGSTVSAVFTVGMDFRTCICQFSIFVLDTVIS